MVAPAARGTPRDLDLYTQAPPPFSDVLPTRTFSGAPGKASSEIVAMMIGANGRTYTWYGDGTTVTGDVGELDSIRAPRTFSAPLGKTVDDTVAVSNRVGGGVVAYYRDGTFSEGTVRDLDSYAAPRAFQTGSGRTPEEILDIDIYSDGRTVTLFEHPRY